MKRSLIIPIIVMILTSLACSVNINLPEMEVGDTLVLNLDQPLTNNSDAVSIDLSMGAGSLSISGGAAGLINGSIEYNVADWEPAISQRS
ncbi:MAG: toast rack family protein, partial [Chloroflexota bacterium]